MRATDQFHAGIVVDDLDAALAQLSDLFGYEWGDEVHVSQPVQLAAGEVSVDFRFRYSRTEPRLELIASQAGTPWTPAEGSGIHHLGYWSDDITADGAALEAAGFEFEAAGVDPDGTRIWSYHRRAGRPRVELISRALQPLLEPLWAG
jgi:hypothetical protein